MGTMDYFRSAIQDLHKSISEAIEGLTDDQLHFRALDTGNHIAFILWHYVRTCKRPGHDEAFDPQKSGARKILDRWQSSKNQI